MNNRGIALVLSLFVVTVLAVLSAAVYTKSINQSNLVKREVHSIEAFWVAEAGLAEGINAIPGTGNITGSIRSGYTYDVNTSVLVSGQYYQIDSTGTVSLPPAINISRSLRAIIRVNPPDPTNFGHAIETTGELVTKGNAYTINGTVNEEAELDFTALFGITKDTMKTNATHLYSDSTFAAPVDGITWVEVSTGVELTIAGSLAGSGILVVEGDAHIAGTVDFDGIIYVIGALRLSGTPVITGAILAESAAEIDTTITGHVTVTYDVGEITSALNTLSFFSRDAVCWYET